MFRDEGGQTTIEYTLVLFIIVGVFIIVVKNLINPLYERLRTAFAKRLQDDIFGGDLHRFRVGR